MTNQLSNARSREEERLWQEWVSSGKHPSQLRPLLDSLQPLVHQTVNKYRTADVAPQALRTHAENRLVEGLNTFDPTRGSSLSTHLNWQMRGVGRFVEKHQNFARIPGSRIRYIGKYQQAQNQLQESLGRAPTWQEIAKKSRIPGMHVQKLQKELSPVHISGLSVDATGAPMSDHSGYTFNADAERLELIYPDLSPQEQLVVDHTVGRNGRQKIISNKLLAQRLGVTDARVSNIRAAIGKKLQSLSWMR